MRRSIVVGLAAGLLLALGIDGSATSDAPPKLQPASLIGALRLTDPDPMFGGFSAVSISADGRDILALSDRGAYVRGTIRRDADGVADSAQFGAISLLLGSDGAVPVPELADSEGLAIGTDGRTYVSFEGATRVSRYPGLDGIPTDLPRHIPFAQLPLNKGLEALAIDADGTLFALPEVLEDATIPVYVFENGSWRDGWTVPRVGRFRPVAADFGPDGRLYLLERRFQGLSGFATRLRRFDVRPDGLSDGVILLQTPAGLHDNLEGLSIWRPTNGGLRATMISDDNFFALQVTEIVEYSLPD